MSSTDYRALLLDQTIFFLEDGPERGAVHQNPDCWKHLRAGREQEYEIAHRESQAKPEVPRAALVA